jgi:hypothetical protein
MDAAQITTIVAILVAFLGIIKYFNSRENLLWAEVGKLRNAIADVRENYNNKFATVNGNIANTELRIVKSISESEDNVRTSHHNATESITKTMHGFEMTMAVLSERVGAFMKDKEQ